MQPLPYTKVNPFSKISAMWSFSITPLNVNLPIFALTREKKNSMKFSLEGFLKLTAISFTS
jgi:hypothetical protein